jgi:arylsulfatase A-like enzyme
MTIRMRTVAIVIALVFTGGLIVLINTLTHTAKQPLLTKRSCRDCNIIVLSLGSLRTKSLPCYGYSKDTAPNLCALAKKSLLLTNGFTTASKTLDTHMSLVTGLYPQSHGVTVPFESMLPDAIPTLPQILKNHGYETYFLGPMQDPHLPLSMGFGKGIAHASEALGPRDWRDMLMGIDPTRKFYLFAHSYYAHEPYMPSDESLAKFYDGPERIHITETNLCSNTVTRLRELHSDRFTSIPVTIDPCYDLREYQLRFAAASDDFDETYTLHDEAYWHAFDVLPAEKRASYIQAMYEARIYELDKELGEFFAFLESKNLMRNTIIVATSDHGEEFFEHGGKSHGNNLYDEGIHVPMIIYDPHQTGKTSPTLMSAVDILPTLLDLVDIAPPSRLSGISLASRFVHQIIVAAHVPDNQLAVISARRAFLSTNETGRALYNRMTDSEEHTNIITADPGAADAMTRKYFMLSRLFPLFTQHDIKALPGWLSPKDKERLIKTGYF